MLLLLLLLLMMVGGALYTQRWWDNFFAFDMLKCVTFKYGCLQFIHFLSSLVFFLSIPSFVCILPPNLRLPIWNDLTKYAIFLVSIVFVFWPLLFYTMSFFCHFAVFLSLFKWFITYFCRTTFFPFICLFTSNECDSRKKNVEQFHICLKNK